MAEPNLMTMSGHRAGSWPAANSPARAQSTGGASNTTTVEWKDFGVKLDFLPFVIDDETIRMTVTPEVSTIDYSLGTTLVVGGSPVPGLNTRNASTTVELRQGQTLAIAGLLQVSINAETSRIPGLGDLPIIGPMFSNTSHERQEKELVVLVTPYLAAPMEACQVPALPGADIKDPTAWEFYFLNRIEGRPARTTGRRCRTTASTRRTGSTWSTRASPGPWGFRSDGDGGRGTWGGGWEAGSVDQSEYMVPGPGGRGEDGGFVAARRVVEIPRSAGTSPGGGVQIDGPQADAQTEDAARAALT